MFKSLKEKLSGWFKKEEPEKEEKPKSKKVEKKEKSVNKSEKKEVKKIPEKKSLKKEAHEGVEKSLKEKAAKVKDEVPVKLSGKAIVPDVEKLREELAEKSEEKKEKVVEVKEKKEGFFGKIKKAFSEEKEIEEKREEIEERAEELQKEIEEEIVEKAKVEPEPLAAEEVEEEIEEKKGFFGKLARKLTASELGQSEFDEMFDELELALLENNVALDVVDKIKEKLKEKLVGKQFTAREVEGKILGALKDAIDSVLIEPEDLIARIKKSEKPFVILFFGINGSGKTTSIAKLAYKLKKNGLNVVLAAADTFRAASIEQLETHASRVGVDIVKGEYGKDPSAVAFDAIAFGKKHKKDVVLIDTAGRMYTKSNLMKEMEKIVKISKPDLKIFVGESITGNDGTEQAKMFHETAGIDGIILSKADIDEKAGTILSVSYVTGKPIYFLGVGQEYDDLEDFKKAKVLEHLGLD